MPWVQRFPAFVCGGGSTTNHYRVADRTRYSSSFNVHNHTVADFGQKPFDEKEKLGQDDYGITLASSLLPFVGFEEIRSLPQASQRRPQTITFPMSPHQWNVHCDCLGRHFIRNRSSPKEPRGGKDHDEFVPVARALDRQRYF